MRTAVYGLWHLGSVTAACLARAGHEVRGLDPDEGVVAGLRSGRPPVREPGLAELTAAELAAGRLRFTADPAEALAGAELLWVAFDTPVDDDDEADVGFVRAALEKVACHVPPGALVLISSQVPVGFTAALERDWAGRGLRFAVSPENLRLGKALEAFCRQERIIVGTRGEADRGLLGSLLGPFCRHIEWMAVESAEMTKHALNAFLATSVTFINELARLCEAVGADAKEVERGLKSEGRIGPRAYLAPGSAFAGGTLARDVRYLLGYGRDHGIATPLFQGVRDSNDVHKGWLREQVARALRGAEAPTVAVLGLTYKPGTSTLRRSASVELCAWLHARGARVQAHDPAVTALPGALAGRVSLCGSPEEALARADVAVVATEWPEFRLVQADELVRRMRRPVVIDPNHFLAGLASCPAITYVATGLGRAA